jgi:hypothetical protein
MQTAQPATSPLPADWTAILTRIQQEITASLATVTQRAESLEPPARPRHSSDEVDAKLRPGQQRLVELERCAHRMDQDVVELDGSLGHGEDALRIWLAAIVSNREKLKAWSNVTVVVGE